jgi:SAM-dependent methyltransferase
LKDVPSDYYRQLHLTEQRHWWYRGMLEIEAALLGDRLARTGQSLLDAGCGAGGFLAWARSIGTFDRLAGIDPSGEAIELARAALPNADLRVGSAHDLPFEDASFDLAVLNDVIQHVHENEVAQSLRELRRVLRPSGALLVRTNGGLRGFRARDDWRKYDRHSLAQTLRRSGLDVERLTAANTALSLLAAARGRTPRAPTDVGHGIPVDRDGARARVGESLLRLEARYLRHPGRTLPYGHTLLALATPA